MRGRLSLLVDIYLDCYRNAEQRSGFALVAGVHDGRKRLQPALVP